MITIGLDLAFKTCGYAKVEGGVFSYDSLVIKSGMPDQGVVREMVSWVWNKIENSGDHQQLSLILEDIFKGKNWNALKNTARIQGAIEDRFIKLTGKLPQYVLASEARNKLRIPVTSTKVELQKWVSKKLNLSVPSELYENIDRKIALYQNLSKQQKIEKKIIEADLLKYSNSIAQVTGLNHHCADAIILVMEGL